jgi:hypothetical protein
MEFEWARALFAGIVGGSVAILISEVPMHLWRVRLRISDRSARRRA